ncbi:MAG: serine/threonine-protein phosphatase, partial [Kiritimatiellae bacterium]|nr:serine/threonine-protein phosphatase [Kiritimatiellia bacterium]
MKRRWIIIASTFALYIAILAVTWLIGTRQARQKTDAQLDYAVMDLNDTIGGAIDTMLGHVARTAVRHIGTAKYMSLESMAAGAKELDIDEVNTVNREGEIIASNDPHCLGAIMAGDPVMEPFMELTNGVTATVSQPFRPHARNPEVRAKYLGAAFPGGDGFVQVGLDERRLAKMLPSILGYIFDEWLLGRTGFFLCADLDTGRLISNPSRHRDQAHTLAEAGYNVEEAKKYEVIAQSKITGETFTQHLFGETCFCRAFLFGGHRFVAALPMREYYDTRAAFVTLVGAILFLVLAAFAWFIDRIMTDTDRLKAFYAAERAQQVKDLAIARTIQTATLPLALPDSPMFRLSADMAPAREVGGDFYDFFLIDATHLVFLIADVSGKGITAALYMMTAKTLIKDALLTKPNPAEALMWANRELCRNNPANMFLTAWVGVLDLETGTVQFVNAGHNPPVVLRKGGTASPHLEPALVKARSGCVLAFMDDTQYRPHTLTLSPGDVLFLYTDGVTEALNENGALLGEEELLAALRAEATGEPVRIGSLVRAVVTA